MQGGSKLPPSPGSPRNRGGGVRISWGGSGTPLSCPGCWGRLRRLASRLDARGEQAPPLPEPPSLVRDVGGAFGASLCVWLRGLVISGIRDSHTRAKPLLAATSGLLQGGSKLPPSLRKTR